MNFFTRRRQVEVLPATGFFVLSESEVVVPNRNQTAGALLLAASVAITPLFGCDGSLAKTTSGPTNNTPTPILAATPEIQEVNQAISDIMNDASRDYKPLVYEYSEELLTILDKVETHLKSGKPLPDPRPMKNLAPEEEIAHFRETIHRWEVQTGKTLRKTLDPLLTEVAARSKTPAKPGSPFHPEWQKKFRAAFDDFIPIEVLEIRERRNRRIHELAKPKLDEYRAKARDAVKEIEDMLARPPYNLPAGTPAKS